MTQAEAAKTLGIRQPHLSLLMHNRAGSFSLGRLMEFLIAPGQDGEVAVRPSRRGHGEMFVLDAAQNSQRPLADCARSGNVPRIGRQNCLIYFGNSSNCSQPPPQPEPATVQGCNPGPCTKKHKIAQPALRKELRGEPKSVENRIGQDPAGWHNSSCPTSLYTSA